MRKKVSKGLESGLERMTELMIKRMESIQLDWKKPWVDSSIKDPRNITGRAYHGWNRLMLIFLQMEQEYEMPVYMTFNQASQLGAKVKAGEKGFPVIHVQYTIRGHDGSPARIDKDAYDALTRDQQTLYSIRSSWRTYTVFNVSQTDLEQSCPEMFEGLRREYQQSRPALSVKGSNEPLDAIIQGNAWICPIVQRMGGGSCFSTLENRITLPPKDSFNHYQEYYTTLLHEMAHSTGMPDVLGRDMKAGFGSEGYAREELIAELSCAMEALNLGITSGIQDNNVAYLQNWVKALSWQPDFLKLILPEVERTVSFLDRKIHDIYLRIRESTPLKDENDGIRAVDVKRKYSGLTAPTAASCRSRPLRRPLRKKHDASGFVGSLF